jgi:(p)ppGpp synthase/HD superfamily hydrolase
MKTNILILLFTYLSNILAVDKNIIYKHQLRTNIEKERNLQTQRIINKEYEKIYNKILEEVNMNNTKIEFKILCFDQKDNENDILKIINMYKIHIDNCISIILDKIKTAFLDKNIISSDYCLDYTLFW